ncbi:peptidoglycan D,D-transpeptidase FtsI family protein [Candidatus Desulforudis audaxviator]|uniref:Peptidoglycan glycosyltransferase n=1 Tax=Desulforudis audaxviator (strain MP104C) TaxID=477974 RepID=B1I377_DESAP|nr:penicillin-binding protein 2 [Candidatus Desulforudis audaxviator]ACA59432.1 Peptidoglycan glycosyltransferase [Candidatus Desulforudis audaxviator MP104C]
MEQLRRRRVRWVFVGLVAALALLAGKLGEVQITQHAAFRVAKLSQTAVQVSLESVPRGAILDRNLFDLTGRHAAARIVVIPQLLPEREGLAAELAAILGVDAGEIRAHLDSPGILPYPLSRVQKETVLARGWPGVGVLPVAFRYGERPVAAHVLGHLGPHSPAASGAAAEPGRLAGKSGIELFYEPELAGRQPVAVVRSFFDARGLPLPGLGLVVETHKGDDGRQDVRLTLDLAVQEIVEEVMDRKIETGAVVVLDIATGDILALASRPDYHPARVGEYLSSGVADVFNNQALALYQPGSIFKIVVAAAALEEGIVAPDTTFACAGHEDRLVRCWLAEGHGAVGFAEAFAVSCNPAFARLALQLGSDKVVEYARRFKLDQQAVIGFPFPPDRRQDLDLISRPYNLVNAGIGQGPVLVNPLQITALVAAVGRDGVYIPPRLVIEIRRENRVVRTLEPGAPERIMTAGTARAMNTLLKSVIAGELGEAARVPGWGSAGKTGTAQTANGNNNAWFSGYVPAEKPRYAITVFVRGGGNGGQSAAPVFREVAEQILAH